MKRGSDSVRLKVLDGSLLCVLAGMAGGAGAAATDQDPGWLDDAAGDACAVESGCRTGPVRIDVTSHGSSSPSTRFDAHATSAELQPDRRVTLTRGAEPGTAVAAGKWSVSLPGKGVVWATEDPIMGQPQARISGPASLMLDGNGRLQDAATFRLRTNYPAFIDRAEILIFHERDVDLVSPVARLALPAGGTGAVTWDGVMLDGRTLRGGEGLVYVAKLHGAKGGVDETRPRRLHVQRSALDAVSGAVAPGGADVDVGDGNDLARQTIAIHGSRVRLYGRDITGELSINDQRQRIDVNRAFAAEYLVPVGHHAFTIETDEPDGMAGSRVLEMDVNGNALFATGIADLTFSRGRASGRHAAFDPGGRLNDGALAEGRLAVYLKGRYRGRYGITAQADTRENTLDRLFSGFTSADPRDLFRRLDNMTYAPVHGDDSTTIRDVDTQGRAYLRIEDGDSHALWGNYHTGLEYRAGSDGTWLSEYSRGLYGASAYWGSPARTREGLAATEVRAFASRAESVAARSAFLGTGGSLYYLQHTDVLPGSEKIFVEVQDPTTGRVLRRRQLHPGADYQINSLQGRVLLTQPLAGAADHGASPWVSQDGPLTGLRQVLIVDYEHIPRGFDPDAVVRGARVRQWIGNHLAVGVTGVDEGRSGGGHAVASAEVLLQASPGTWLKVEQGRSRAAATETFVSDNGGLEFRQLATTGQERHGTARQIEARVNLKESGLTRDDWIASAWSRDIGDGHAVALAEGVESIQEQGGEINGTIGDGGTLSARHTQARRGRDGRVQTQLAARAPVGEKSSVGLELRRSQERRGDATRGVVRAEGVVAAVTAVHRPSDVWELSSTVQKTVSDDGGRYRRNDAVSVGARRMVAGASSIGAELVRSTRGDAARITAERRIGQQHTLYGGYAFSPDQDAYDPLFNPGTVPGWTLGQRWQLSEQVNVFNESQFLETKTTSGIAHTFGLDVRPAPGWTSGVTLQQAVLERPEGEVERRAVSVSTAFSTPRTQLQGKLEWRRDADVARSTQWLGSGRVTHQFNDDIRLAAKVDHSRTRDRQQSGSAARYLEANAGLAWRPVASQRWALLGRIVALEDVATLGQQGHNVATYDQRTLILAAEGIHRPHRDWELSAKVARREARVRHMRQEGTWAAASTTFLAGQARYAFAPAWSAAAEYRWLGVGQAGVRHGVVASVDRQVTDNLRIGLGYNFTRFSDDLTDLTYRHRGVRLNVVGSF